MSPQEINVRLQQLERDQGVRILFAIESGSRAWGFASPDSDYDVRAVYVRPLEAYLSLIDSKEMIDVVDGDYDLTAWNLRKFLRLAGASNATPLEWLQSPVAYREVKGMRSELLALCADAARLQSLLHHYMGLATSSWAGFGESGKDKLKRLFYVLRPLLAARWIADRGEVPPMAFAPLLAVLPQHAPLGKIQELVALKMKVDESYQHRLSSQILEFVESEFVYLRTINPPQGERIAKNENLTAFFQRTVKAEIF